MNESTTRERPAHPPRHIVIIHRWRAAYADYESYLDHTVDTVTYVTTSVGADRVPGAAAGIAIVSSTDNLPEVRAAVRDLAGEHGSPDAIVALKEDDLLIAAKLRAEWDCAGDRPADLLVFRDKYVMASAVAGQGLPVPAFAEAPGAEAVFDFAEEHGWPLIVKPRLGSSSAGVLRLEGPADVADVPFDGPESLLVQVCDPNPIYHVDGVFVGGRVVAFRASRYVNTCLGFRNGVFLGSVEEDDPVRNAAIGSWTDRFLSAFGVDALVFHLELFLEQEAGREPTCTFLEVGARVGGAEIPFLWRDVHGYDLMAAAMRIQLGEPVEPPELGEVAEVAGWLLAPAPAQRPCRISNVTPMVGREPGPYAEELPQIGDVVPLADAYYEHVGGRFRFRGLTSGDVEKAILLTAADFQVSGDSL